MVTAVASLVFHKLQALGNDFVLLDCRANGVPGIDGIPFAALADRRLGVGCDQFLLLRQAPEGSGAAAMCRFVNADGSHAGQCGNGLRAIALYLQARGELADEGSRLLCNGKEVAVHAADGNNFKVDMGPPVFAAADIPVASDARELTIQQQRWPFVAVSMGNPHAVIQVEDVATAPLEEIAAGGWKDIYPEGVNVGVMQVESSESIRLRVHERGVGETPACGTGACAAVVAGRGNGLLTGRVRVKMTGGSVAVEWAGEAGDHVWMTGPASHVYEGRIPI